MPNAPGIGTRLAELQVEERRMAPLVLLDGTERIVTGLMVRVHSDAASAVVKSLSSAPGTTVERCGSDGVLVSFSTPVPEEIALRKVARRLRNAAGAGGLSGAGRAWTILLSP